MSLGSICHVNACQAAPYSTRHSFAGARCIFPRALPNWPGAAALRLAIKKHCVLLQCKRVPSCTNFSPPPGHDASCFALPCPGGWRGHKFPSCLGKACGVGCRASVKDTAATTTVACPVSWFLLNAPICESCDVLQGRSAVLQAGAGERRPERGLRGQLAGGCWAGILRGLQMTAAVSTGRVSQSIVDEESFGSSSLDVCKTKCIYNVKCTGPGHRNDKSGHPNLRLSAATGLFASRVVSRHRVQQRR